MQKLKKHSKIFFLITILMVMLGTNNLIAQESEVIQKSSTFMWFGALELPFLFLALIFSFITANALKGGIFGRGMLFVAWGFLVMAIGHLHMQIEHFFHINLFGKIFGEIFGTLLWFIALIITWTLSGLGFYNIFKASKGG
jgi:hypothetical protein